MNDDPDQIRGAVVRAEENTSWRADKRGVTAGGDPSGSRRSISIQNHAYDFGRATHTLAAPNRRRNGIINGESAVDGARCHEPADRCLWRRRTPRCYAGCKRETPGKSSNNDKIILARLESTSPDISCGYSLKCPERLVFLRAGLVPVLRPVSMETGGCQLRLARDKGRVEAPVFLTSALFQCNEPQPPSDTPHKQKTESVFHQGS